MIQDKTIERLWQLYDKYATLNQETLLYEEFRRDYDKQHLRELVTRFKPFARVVTNAQISGYSVAFDNLVTSAVSIFKHRTERRHFGKLVDAIAHRIAEELADKGEGYCMPLVYMREGWQALAYIESGHFINLQYVYALNHSTDEAFNARLTKAVSDKLNHYNN